MSRISAHGVFGINNLGQSHPHHPVCSTRETSYSSGPVVEEDVRVFVLRGTAESLTRILYSAESAGSVVQPFLSAPILATALFCGHVQQSQLVNSASDAVFRSITVSVVSAVPSGKSWPGQVRLSTPALGSILKAGQGNSPWWRGRGQPSRCVFRHLF
jgi:hypothetical protein